MLSEHVSLGNFLNPVYFYKVNDNTFTYDGQLLTYVLPLNDTISRLVTDCSLDSDSGCLILKQRTLPHQVKMGTGQELVNKLSKTGNDEKIHLAEVLQQSVSIH